ncbi:structural maintenance of chromosomes protein 6B-like isoform X2 [Durio zibethinus]|uniref:Structural maintenance of chromosomes protein 6B-like isoform X2 n=1 Tax=Durio zibethinus TaxID=66656 RepID=A0A6P6B3Q3_DURZI|nr:structural maintenance of chromosomes protein 6B-like isoform X2 [Durio zibethinus]
MSVSRVSSDQIYGAQRSGAGTIKRIRLENFMCHSSLEIELGEWVNFIAGQNGSGKSAILTALCIAFGSRAKDTQRASKLKEFIKTGCSYAIVQVEIKNEGVDAFKPEIYGDTIIIERRISDSTSSTVLKDRQGKKVASRKEDLRELVEHFNIDVENPCVIMSQDKSREFLHSGNDKDKFKFFFKATLLQQVDELLQSIIKQLKDAYALVDELENLIRPIQLELSELQEKIENIKRVEQISQEVQLLKKKLAWSWVYDVDGQLQRQREKIEKLKERIPTCQAKIDSALDKLVKLQELFSKKKDQVAALVEKTSEVRRRKDELWDAFCLATKEKLELEEEHGRNSKQIHKMRNDVRMLEEQAHDIQEKHIRNTQAEESEIEEHIKELEYAVDHVKSILSSLKDDENTLSEHVSAEMDAMKKINDEIKCYEKKQHEIDHQIHELRLHQTNRVTAFGGDGVLRLLRAIERRHRQFTMPPIGPIGAHVFYDYALQTLVDGDTWAPAVEQAIGKLLNAFIVTNSKDASALRECAKEARYNYFPIVIHKFSRPRLIIPNHLLPQTNHPTTLSVIHSDNPTVFNVLVDSGKAERQVLVKDYNVGRAVAFDQRIPNLTEVFTLDGFRMFSRGSVQTILPSNKRLSIGHLCGSFGDQIKEFERHASNVQQEIEKCKSRKRQSEKKLQDFGSRLINLKRRRLGVERDFTAKSLKLQDVQNLLVVDASVLPESTTNELYQEISDVKMEIQGKEALLETLRERMKEAEEKATTLKLSLENLGESTKGEIEAFQKAEEELTEIEKEINHAEASRVHYENVMNNKVLPPIKEAEAQYPDLENSRKESYRKASVICPESEIKALEGWDGSTTEQLSAKLKILNQRLMHESHRYSESIDDLRMLYQEKKHRISRKLETYKAFRERLDACQKALDLRWKKFQRNASLLRRELTWQFNGHLGKKGISGHIKVSYEEKTLSVEVKMPQDASSSIVRDTRGLSGGERSFSTLCFALALHDMTEAPFRAMDEFDVFMDAVSRKISLDTLVEFALAQGSQWIFITPHDISMVKHGERIKKQQMAAPRS